MEYETPENLRYTSDHEWLRREDDSPDEVTIGVTEFAQEQLGDVVYLELPAEGTALTVGAPFGEIESAKTVAELFAPVTGELIATNGALEDHPELVNESPFDEGWIVRVRISDETELDALLDAAAYRELLPED